MLFILGVKPWAAVLLLVSFMPCTTLLMVFGDDLADRLPLRIKSVRAACCGS